METISVVVPTFNRAGVVVRALRSIVAQSRPADEIVVVDDGSTDETAEKVSERVPQARVLSQEHRGVSAARNRGIEASVGEWIALLDSDDEWAANKLERQFESLARRAGYRVCHTDEIWIRDGRRVNPARRHGKRGGWMFRHCLPLCAISPSSVLIHRSVFKQVGLFDEQLPACEDYDLWLRICARFPVLLVDEPLVVKHGGHVDQLSRTVWGLDRFRIRALEKILASGALSEDDRRAAVATLIDKVEIFAAGAEKRGRSEEAKVYRRKLELWREVSLEGARGR